MEYAIYNKNGIRLTLNEVDEDLCKMLNTKVDPNEFCELFNDLTFIGSVSIDKNNKGLTTPETVKAWVESPDNHYSTLTVALVSYLLTYEYDIKSWYLLKG